MDPQISDVLNRTQTNFDDNDDDGFPEQKSPPKPEEAPHGCHDHEEDIHELNSGCPLPCNILNRLTSEYEANKKKIDASYNDHKEINYITEHIKKNKIKCIKYNYALEGSVQNYFNFEATIGLSNDESSLIINNIKPSKNQYILESDPHEVKKKQQEYNKKKQNMKLKGGKEKSDQNEEEDHEIDRSSGSCKVSDIQGIIYGGLSSRFWMFRKHVMFTRFLRKKDETKLPFFAWDCVTLQLSHRDVDLVIRDEKQMAMFLKFLIYKMQTLDGKQGTALGIQKTLFDQECREA